jgi:XTP/dITP diphosphohydrolase
MTLLVATRSAHKLLEIRRILASIPGLRTLDLNDAGIPPSPEEDDIEVFETFEENALAKARHFHSLSGLPTVADDSGLMVDALTEPPAFAPRGSPPPPTVSMPPRWTGRTTNISWSA